MQRVFKLSPELSAPLLDEKNSPEDNIRRLKEINKELEDRRNRVKRLLYADHDELLNLKRHAEREAKKMNFKPDIDLQTHRRKQIALMLKMDPESSVDALLAVLKTRAEAQVALPSKREIDLASEQAALMASLSPDHLSAALREIKRPGQR